MAGAVADAAESAAEPTGPIAAVTRPVELPLLPPEPPARLRELAESWRAERAHADGGRARMLEAWEQWAEVAARDGSAADPARATITALRWGEIKVVALPGEPLVELALDIERCTAPPVVVVGYANGVPGYIPHRSAYAEGGYEPCEAHRFYGRLAPEAAELLVEEALRAIEHLPPSPHEKGTACCESSG